MHVTVVAALLLAARHTGARTFGKEDSTANCSLKPRQVCGSSPSRGLPQLYVYDADEGRCWQMPACEKVQAHAFSMWVHCRVANKHCSETPLPTTATTEKKKKGEKTKKPKKAKPSKGKGKNAEISSETPPPTTTTTTAAPTTTLKSTTVTSSVTSEKAEKNKKKKEKRKKPKKSKPSAGKQ
ncbi:salivary glue protein Sgs-3-like [Ornithodoros turicata]|uniref:salivary glue protein Sgs-3-like n=1 Tax=Ornithodoros turicata TaxID=34597 RepID=UPI00313874FD